MLCIFEMKNELEGQLLNLILIKKFPHLTSLDKRTLIKNGIGLLEWKYTIFKLFFDNSFSIYILAEDKILF